MILCLLKGKNYKLEKRIYMETIVENLEDYVNYIQQLDKEFVLSRGQGEDKPLLPSVLRLDESDLRFYSKTTAGEFINEIKNNSTVYLDNSKMFDTHNEFEWIILAQHFGVPTCLLDFTYSHLVSLMFAVENAFKYSEDDVNNSVVWFLNPQRLNLESINRSTILNLSEETRVLDSAEYPCVVTAMKNNSRMAAQNGLFVYFQQEAKALEKLNFSDCILKKIIIPHANAKSILASLYTMGMRFKDIYPELTSVSKDILLKHDVMEYYRMEAEINK